MPPKANFHFPPLFSFGAGTVPPCFLAMVDGAVESCLSSDERERLSAAGFVHHPDEKVVDELDTQSGYTSSLASLRAVLENALPEMGSIVSVSIIAAFSEEGGNSKKRTRTQPAEAADIEVNALHQAYEWMAEKRRSDFASCKGEGLALLQDQTTKVVGHVRRGKLSPSEASRIILAVASMLGLKPAVRSPRDTVLIAGLSLAMNSDHVLSAMRAYGVTDCVRVAAGNSGFAMCRFRSPPSVQLVIDAFRKGGLAGQDAKRCVFEPHSPTYPAAERDFPGNNPGRAVPEEEERTSASFNSYSFNSFDLSIGDNECGIAKDAGLSESPTSVVKLSCYGVTLAHQQSSREWGGGGGAGRVGPKPPHRRHRRGGSGSDPFSLESVLSSSEFADDLLQVLHEDCGLGGIPMMLRPRDACEGRVESLYLPKTL